MINTINLINKNLHAIEKYQKLIYNSSLKRSIALVFIGEESPGKAERRSVESTDIRESIESVTENNRSKFSYKLLSKGEKARVKACRYCRQRQ